MSQIQRISSSRAAVVNENSVLVITGTLKDEDGATIPKSAVDAFTLKLIDKDTDQVINSRDEADIMDSLASDGTFELVLDQDDNPILTAGAHGTKEEHLALLHVVWTDGVQKEHWQDQPIDVRRLQSVGDDE